MGLDVSCDPVHPPKDGVRLPHGLCHGAVCCRRAGFVGHALLGACVCIVEKGGNDEVCGELD